MAGFLFEESGGGGAGRVGQYDRTTPQCRTSNRVTEERRYMDIHFLNLAEASSFDRLTDKDSGEGFIL
ncbi:hypothetical protein JNB11_01165 [Kocuria palustris]|nr:hypothetical protein [Kocuria palustris]